MAFPQVATQLRFEPYSSKAYSVLWSGVLSDGTQLPAGNYRAQGMLVSDDFANDPISAVRPGFAPGELYGALSIRLHPAWGPGTYSHAGHPIQEPTVKLTYSLAALAACAALAFPVTRQCRRPAAEDPGFQPSARQGHRFGGHHPGRDVVEPGEAVRGRRRQRDDDEALAILSDIKSLRVRNFEFDSDGAYSRADVDSVRQQLSAPGWTPLVQAHKREPQEDVDVFINTDDGKILGMAVVVSEPRSFTIVNIIGSIDIDKLAKLEGQFGIPRVSQPE